MATVDLGEDSRDAGVGDTPQAGVRVALRALGEPYAGEMAELVELGESQGRWPCRYRHDGRWSFDADGAKGVWRSRMPKENADLITSLG